MRHIALVLLVVGGCTLPLLPKAPVWDANRGEVECSIGGPVAATAITAIAGALTVSSLGATTQPTSDLDGHPTNPSANIYAWAGTTAAFALVSTIGWISHARCERLQTEMQALVAATDCGEVKRIDADISSFDSTFRDSVLTGDSKIERCVATGSIAEPARPQLEPAKPQLELAPAPGDCVGQRRVAMLRAQRINDPTERARILTNLPTCEPSP
ncbi:MAG TPA: hypothetical protein VF403_10195 [Kofleriaceae bacterium]